jgi:hypothetical protein
MSQWHCVRLLWSLLRHLLPVRVLPRAEKCLLQLLPKVRGQHMPDKLSAELLPAARPVKRLHRDQPNVQEVHCLPHVPGQLSSQLPRRGGHRQPLLRHPEVQEVHPLHVRLNLPGGLLPRAGHHQRVLCLQPQLRQVHGVPQLRHQLPGRVLLSGARHQQPVQCSVGQHVPEMQHLQLSTRHPRPV